jgi:hypothetical protein
MPGPTSLLDWILSLLRDPEARAAFQSDPDRYATAHGFQDLSPADVHDALCLIADNASASYDHKFSPGSVDSGAHYPPPPHHLDLHRPASHYLNDYITHNYTTVLEHDTNVDESVHQNVDTHGGDFHQTVDNDPLVASGDHAVAAGGDIRGSTLTSGDGNVVGDGDHAVTGHDDTTSFGSGDATGSRLSHADFGDGSAFSAGGDASGHQSGSDTRTDVHSSGSGGTSVDAAGAHGHAGQYADQSAHDGSTHSSYQDDPRVDSHDSDRYSDSHDADVHHA